MIDTKAMYKELLALRKRQGNAALKGATHVSNWTKERVTHCVKHETCYGKYLVANYAFTRPVASDGSLTAYFIVMLACEKGAEPSLVSDYMPSVTNRSHLYNSGYLVKKSGKWYLTAMGQRYVNIVKSYYPANHFDNFKF